MKTASVTTAGEWLANDPRIDDLVEALRAGGPRIRRAGNLWGSSQALALTACLEHAPGPWLVLTATQSEADSFALDLEQFGASAAILPARGGDEGSSGADADAVRDRLRFAQSLEAPAERRPRLMVAPLLSALQPLPLSGEIEGSFATVQRGSRLGLEELLQKLVNAGYSREPLAERPGEVSLRGDVLDVFGYADEIPLRVELFDDVIESIRRFDPETQRSIETLERAAVCLASDPGGVEDGQGQQLLTRLSSNTTVATVEPLRVDEQAHGLRVRSTSHARALDELAATLKKRLRLELQSLPSGEHDFDGRSIQGLSVGLPGAAMALAKETRAGFRVRVLCRTEAEQDKLKETLAEALPADRATLKSVELEVGALAKGFRLPKAKLIAINHHELAGVTGVGRTRLQKKTSHKVRALESFFELKVGDLVVHAVHGLARYIGLERMERGGGEEDHLHLSFDGDVSLYVPACRVDLVQRYVGTGSAAPKLDKMGSGAFRKRKGKVERALIDLAGDLLEVQARREQSKRTPWEPEEGMVQDLLEAFPFEDTPDQKLADGEIAGDLQGQHPMDRLLCGDVGFGKTEVAMRAAFRVVAAGGQVAVLVPTTVLADQHLISFQRRLAGFPIEVRGISRLNAGAKAKKIVEEAASGRVDILIGTHRILSKDVTFANLGLVIIDEEQRFGVKHKEHFKALRSSVDVLALSATPIPRTLHMSLSGVRDISALTHPPPGRQAVETKIANRDDFGLIRDVLLREKQRGGQVFYLHNRVDDLVSFTEDLRTLVPECSFLEGHGQMPARLLNKVMASFTKGEADVLVSTTIVENGIDIPAAGTILIDQADRFGLAELHQLRGRVGRNQQRSWCYLLIDRTRPLRQIAKERLKALEELSHLGAGFQISMKDLELRGAGNLLGPEQSGHIAAIGYDMYCRLLAQTVEQLGSGGLPSEVLAGAGKAGTESVELELGLRAYLPAEWVAGADARLELLRKLDGIASDEDADRIQAELADRFGRLPPPALALLRQFRLRSHLRELSITRLSWRQDSYVVEFTDRVALEGGLAAAVERAGKLDLRPLRTGVALLMVPPTVDSAARGIDWLEDLLQSATGLQKMSS